MTRISLVSFALILIVSHASQALADPLADKVTSMNAQWDAAINNADFDALLPLYAADGRLMPPGAPPVTGPLATVISLLGGEEASEITSLSWWMRHPSGTMPIPRPISRPR